MSDLTVEYEDDGRIFLKHKGLVVFIARTKEAIDKYVHICYPGEADPDADKNDWTDRKRVAPFWRY